MILDIPWQVAGRGASPLCDHALPGFPRDSHTDTEFDVIPNPLVGLQPTSPNQVLTHAARAAAKAPLVAARGAREGLWLEQQPTVIASRAPHLLLEQSVMTLRFEESWTCIARQKSPSSTCNSQTLCICILLYIASMHCMTAGAKFESSTPIARK